MQKYKPLSDFSSLFDLVSTFIEFLLKSLLLKLLLPKLIGVSHLIFFRLRPSVI